MRKKFECIKSYEVIHHITNKPMAIEKGSIWELKDNKDTHRAMLENFEKGVHWIDIPISELEEYFQPL